MTETQTSSISYPVIADIGGSDELRDEISDALNIGNVMINLGKVERVSTSALFMLLSAARTAEMNDFKLSLCDPSEHFCNALAVLGLEGEFAPLMKG